MVLLNESAIMRQPCKTLEKTRYFKAQLFAEAKACGQTLRTGLAVWFTHIQPCRSEQENETLYKRNVENTSSELDCSKCMLEALQFLVITYLSFLIVALQRCVIVFLVVFMAKISKSSYFAFNYYGLLQLLAD